jgi:hypothetical protein
MLCQYAAESANVLLEGSYLLPAIETMAGREVVREERCVSANAQGMGLGWTGEKLGGKPSIGRAQRLRRNWNTGGCDSSGWQAKGTTTM